VYSPGLVGRIKATRYTREYGLDFDDALTVQAMEGLSMDAIVPYDRCFDAVDRVERATPEELLSMHGGGG